MYGSWAHRGSVAGTIGAGRKATMNPEPLPAQDTDLKKSIIGVWGLTAREDYDQHGNRLIDPHLGADPIGMLAFSQDHFSAQFSKRDRSEPSEAVAVQTANNSAAVNGYDAYFGRYWIDETGEAIVVHLEGSITPANTGQEFTRITRASDDQLLIRLDTSTDEGTPITRTLTFQRLP
jgi:hypothetical protein